MNTPKAPSPWPPRVTVCRDKDTGALNVIAAENFPSIPLAQLDFISRAEHIHLLAEAVREAKAQVYSEVADFWAKPGAGIVGPVQYYRKKAAELRENGEKK